MKTGLMAAYIFSLVATGAHAQSFDTNNFLNRLKTMGNQLHMSPEDMQKATVIGTTNGAIPNSKLIFVSIGGIWFEATCLNLDPPFWLCSVANFGAAGFTYPK
jgi:hypothetical protein